MAIKKVETTKVEATKAEASKTETTNAEATNAEATKVEASKVEASKAETISETKDYILNKLSSDKIENVTKQIWLAGLGAYGRSFDEIQNRYEKINAESQKMFFELVVRGEKLQSDTEDKLKEGKSGLEGRIEKLKSYATLPGNSKVIDQLSEVNRKLDTLKKNFKKMA